MRGIRDNITNNTPLSPELRGVPHQSTVGFLTILEALRYCEVSSNKCPVCRTTDVEFSTACVGGRFPEESGLSCVVSWQWNSPNSAVFYCEDYLLLFLLIADVVFFITLFYTSLRRDCLLPQKIHSQLQGGSFWSLILKVSITEKFILLLLRSVTGIHDVMIVTRDLV